MASQRGVLALITVRARIGVHGIPTGIFRGGFMHGSKLTLLILDLVLQFLDLSELVAFFLVVEKLIAP